MRDYAIVVVELLELLVVDELVVVELEVELDVVDELVVLDEDVVDEEVEVLLEVVLEDVVVVNEKFDFISCPNKNSAINLSVFCYYYF